MEKFEKIQILFKKGMEYPAKVELEENHLISLDQMDVYNI